MTVIIGLGWVGLGPHFFTCSGLGWVGQSANGLGWVTLNGPMDNSGPE